MMLVRIANMEDPDQTASQKQSNHVCLGLFSRQLVCLILEHLPYTDCCMGAQWLSGRRLESRPKGRGFEPHQRHCVVSLSKTH